MAYLPCYSRVGPTGPWSEGAREGWGCLSKTIKPICDPKPEELSEKGLSTFIEDATLKQFLVMNWCK